MTSQQKDMLKETFNQKRLDEATKALQGLDLLEPISDEAIECAKRPKEFLVNVIDD